MTYLVGCKVEKDNAGDVAIYKWPDRSQVVLRYVVYDDKDIWIALGVDGDRLSDKRHQSAEEAAKEIYDAGLGPAKFIDIPVVPTVLPISPEPEADMVNHPPHYVNGDIECIDAIKSALTEEEFRGFVKGSALAYIWREKHKGGNQDIHKAMWYLGKIAQNAST